MSTVKEDGGTQERRLIPRDDGNILVVDDDAQNRSLLCDLLEGWGYTVREAESGTAALEKVSADPIPDAVLLDVMMPGMDGFEVCRELKTTKSLSHVPVLFITALHERNDRLTGIEAGAIDFITKPIDQTEVRLRVRNAVALKKQHDRLERSYLKLQQAEKMRDDLTQMIVHDLRTPLTAVESLLTVLSKYGPDRIQEREANIIRHARGATKTLIDMVSSVLDVSRFEASGVTLTRDIHDVADIVREAITTTGAVHESDQVAFQLPDEAITAYCDPEIMRRVIVNLVDNAIRHSGKNEQVTVDVRSVDEAVKITVQDHGRGIPAEYHEIIFDKFGRVSAQYQRQKYSTGLGLAFCKLAVEAHAGEIGVKSEVGKGSVFWLTIPTRSEARKAEAA